MLINSIGYQPQKSQLQIQNKNSGFGNQSYHSPLLKSLDKDTVSFSGLFGFLKNKKPAVLSETEIRISKLSPEQKELLKKGFLPHVDFLSTYSVEELQAMIENLTKRFNKHPNNDSLEAELRDTKIALEKVLKANSSK